MKNKIIKLFTLITVVIVSISCGKTMTGPEGGGGGGQYLLWTQTQLIKLEWVL